MAEEDPQETIRSYSPQTYWKTMREERKKAAEQERRKVPSDENEALKKMEKLSNQGGYRHHLAVIKSICVSVLEMQWQNHF